VSEQAKTLFESAPTDTTTDVIVVPVGKKWEISGFNINNVDASNPDTISIVFHWDPPSGAAPLDVTKINAMPLNAGENKWIPYPCVLNGGEAIKITMEAGGIINLDCAGFEVDVS